MIELFYPNDNFSVLFAEEIFSQTFSLCDVKTLQSRTKT